LSAVLLLTVVIGAGTARAGGLRGQGSAFVGRPPAGTPKVCQELRSGAGTAGAVGLRGQASAFVGRLPAVTQKFREALRSGRGAISTMKPMQQAANDLKKAAEETGLRPASDVTRVQLEEPAMRLSDLLWRGTMGAVEFAVQATMVLFLGYYMLASGDRYKRKLLEVAGPSRV